MRKKYDNRYNGFIYTPIGAMVVLMLVFIFLAIFPYLVAFGFDILLIWGLIDKIRIWYV